MSIVIAGSISNANTPLIGYENRVTTSNISTTSENASYPATNLANPSTYLKWQGELVSPIIDEYLTVDLPGTDDCDYVGIAKHNFGTLGLTMSVEGLADEDASPVVWTEIVEETLISSDQPLIFKFASQTLDKIRVRLQVPSDATTPPYAAVLYVGAVLELERNIYVGHTPITMGLKTNTLTPRSESGHFLGRVVLSEMAQTKVSLRQLTPEWVRSYLNDFISAAQTDPFFFAWRPQGYPTEVGFAWLTDDPIPVNELPNGMMSVEFQMNGIVS